MQRKKYEMQRFDLYIPEVAANIIEIEADKKNIPARTYGRMLLIEKVKELVGIAPDEGLPVRIEDIPTAAPSTDDDEVTDGAGVKVAFPLCDGTSREERGFEGF